MKFLRNFFASFLAVIAALLIGLPIIFLILGGIIASIGQSSDKVALQPHSVLQIKLDAPIVENASANPVPFNLDDFGPFAASVNNLGLFQIIESIEYAAKDDKVDGIYLNLTSIPQTGWASLKSIRSALLDFKNSGKFIYAYSEVYSENSYYLASVADSVFMAPEGIIEFNGLVSTPTFFLGMFEKLDLKPRIFRVGTYKSAVEPFIRKDMSEASRRQTEAYLGDIWQVFLEDVAASRNLSLDQLDALATDFVFGKGDKALQAGLIERVAYEHEVRNLLIEATQPEAEKPELIALKKYQRVASKASKPSQNKIAVVFAQGNITQGKSQDGTIGAQTVIEELRKARRDEKVKAIVFRVNSPGGDALASDLIAEEVRLCAQAKPIVASYGDVSASGGYYITADCDHIFAQENTITGSIGIFGILFDAQATMNSKLGITFDEVETNESANFANPFFPMSEVEQRLLQNNVEQGYGSFIRTVKNGRGFTDSAAVDQIAQGRVWSGRAAQGLNLIDSYGDLRDAIGYAAQQAGIGNDYRLRLMPRAKNPFEELMTEMMETKVEASVPFHAELEQIHALKRMIPRSGTYALMPYSVHIH
jgi:protease IV